MIESRILAGDYGECTNCTYCVDGECSHGAVPIVEIDFDGRCSHYCVDAESEVLEGAEWLE